jgi:hypothetical protein
MNSTLAAQERGQPRRLTVRHRRAVVTEPNTRGPPRGILARAPSDRDAAWAVSGVRVGRRAGRRDRFRRSERSFGARLGATIAPRNRMARGGEKPPTRKE